MSVRVMAWVWQSSQSKSTARLVLLAIADCANDRGTDAYPSIATLAKKTGLSVRAVHRAIGELDSLGELKVDYKAGIGGTNRYRVMMPDPAPEAGNLASNVTVPTVHSAPESLDTLHVSQGTLPQRQGHSARRAPKPSENHQPTEPSIEPSVPRSTKGTRIPDGFTATPEMIEWARRETPLVGTRETAAFVDYWRSRPGAGGSKADWPATWRNWMRRAQRDAEANRANGRASPVVGGLHVDERTATRMTVDRERMAAMDRQVIEGPREPS